MKLCRTCLACVGLLDLGSLCRASTCEIVLCRVLGLIAPQPGKLYYLYVATVSYVPGSLALVLKDSPGTVNSLVGENVMFV